MKTNKKQKSSKNVFFTKALRLENRKLHEKLVKCEVENISLKNQISALKKDIKRRPNATLEELLTQINEEDKKKRKQ